MDAAPATPPPSAIDGFLARHGVDVGKALGVLALSGAVDALYTTIGTLMPGELTLNFGALLGWLVGVALWRHREWARVLALVVAWAVVVLLLIAVVVAPLTGTGWLKLTLGSTTRQAAPLWMFYATVLLFAPALWFMLAVLHSATARAEFRPVEARP